MITQRQINARTSDRHILHIFDEMMKMLHDGKPRYELRPGRKREDCLKFKFHFTSELKEGKDGQVQNIFLHWTYINYQDKEFDSHSTSPVVIRCYDNDRVFSHYDSEKKQCVFINYATALDREIKRRIMNDWLVKDNTAIPVYI